MITKEVSLTHVYAEPSYLGVAWDGAFTPQLDARLTMDFLNAQAVLHCPLVIVGSGKELKQVCERLSLPLEENREKAQTWVLYQTADTEADAKIPELPEGKEYEVIKHMRVAPRAPADLENTEPSYPWLKNPSRPASPAGTPLYVNMPPRPNTHIRPY